jgi:hypothetical protein
MNDDDGCLVNSFAHSQDSLRVSCIMLSPHQKTVLEQQRSSGKLTSLSAHRVAMLDDPNTILVDCWFLSLLVKARVSGCPMLVTVFTIRCAHWDITRTKIPAGDGKDNVRVLITSEVFTDPVARPFSQA